MKKASERYLWEIAEDIRAHQKPVHPYAAPYLKAMGTLESIDQMYGADSAKSVVLYFLSNAQMWRGEDARRIKKELKQMAGVK